MTGVQTCALPILYWADVTATSGHFTYIWRSGDNWHVDSTWSSTTIRNWMPTSDMLDITMMRVWAQLRSTGNVYWADATATSGHFTYIWRSGDNWHVDSTWPSTMIRNVKLLISGVLDISIEGLDTFVEHIYWYWLKHYVVCWHVKTLKKLKSFLFFTNINYCEKYKAK